MGKINNEKLYPKDRRITINDILIGSDKDKNGVTKNYPLSDVISFINETNDLKFSLYEYSDEDANLNQGVFTISGSNFTFNNVDLELNDNESLFDVIKDNKDLVILYLKEGPENFAYYKITSVTKNSSSFTFSLQQIGTLNTGSYVLRNKYLFNFSVIVSGGIQSDWNQSDVNAQDYIKNKPVIPPANAEANVQSDWNQTNNTEDDFIKNKPVTITDLERELVNTLRWPAATITIQNYANLTDVPSIPGNIDLVSFKNYSKGSVTGDFFLVRIGAILDAPIADILNYFSEAMLLRDFTRFVKLKETTRLSVPGFKVFDITKDYLDFIPSGSSNLVAKILCFPTKGPANIAGTNLSYVAGTRVLESSTGSDVTLPLFTETEAGLVDANFAKKGTFTGTITVVNSADSSFMPMSFPNTATFYYTKIGDYVAISARFATSSSISFNGNNNNIQTRAKVSIDLDLPDPVVNRDNPLINPANLCVNVGGDDVDNPFETKVKGNLFNVSQALIRFVVEVKYTGNAISITSPAFYVESYYVIR